MKAKKKTTTKTNKQQQKTKHGNANEMAAES